MIYVYKFGGNSMAHPEQVVEAIRSSGHIPRVVVVSAIGQSAISAERTTSILRGVCVGLRHPEEAAETIVQTHNQTYQVIGERALDLIDTSAFDDLRESFQTRREPEILAMGERLSARYFTQLAAISGIAPVVMTHEPRYISLDPLTPQVRVDRSLCDELTRDRHAMHVVGGFYGFSDEGRFLLGDGAGDRTGSLISAALYDQLNTDVEYHNWTNVCGVYTADPQNNPDAEHIGIMTRDRAQDLLDAGAEVLNPQALYDLGTTRVPVYVRNTFQPDGPFTRIVRDSRELRHLTVVR